VSTFPSTISNLQLAKHWQLAITNSNDQMPNSSGYRYIANLLLIANRQLLIEATKGSA